MDHAELAREALRLADCHPSDDPDGAQLNALAGIGHALLALHDFGVHLVTTAAATAPAFIAELGKLRADVAVIADASRPHQMTEVSSGR